MGRDREKEGELMLNICGVTFDHTTNYGSCFQAYALQTAIEKMTVNGEKCHYDLLPLATFTDSRKQKKISALGQIKHVLTNALISLRRHRFQEFEDNYMHYANCHAKKDLTLLNEQYDAFVCGSDVIWNFSYTNADETYFLNFANKYKFSYAASFGRSDIQYKSGTIHLNENANHFYKRNISPLNAVGVREEYAVSVAQQFTEKKVVHVCDPVFLLQLSDWSKIVKDCNKPPKPYIFVYNTSDRPIFNWFLKKIQNDTGLAIVHVTWQIKDGIKEKAMFFPDPQTWLGLLANAEYVVTNSFHGTAFATLFQKKFFTVIQDGRETRSNIRLFDFLERMSLADRIVNNEGAEVSYDAPDFSVAKQKIKLEREYGLNYLQENLNAAYRCKQSGV